MPQPISLRDKVVQGSPAWLMAYFTAKVDGVETALTAELVSGVAYQVYEHASDGSVTLVASGSPAPSDVLLDPPVTNDGDSAWPALYATGYNFQHELPGTAFPDGAVQYEVQYVFTLAAGGTFAAAPVYLTSVPSRSA